MTLVLWSLKSDTERRTLKFPDPRRSFKAFNLWSDGTRLLPPFPYNLLSITTFLLLFCKPLSLIFLCYLITNASRKFTTWKLLANAIQLEIKVEENWNNGNSRVEMNFSFHLFQLFLIQLSPLRFIVSTSTFHLATRMNDNRKLIISLFRISQVAQLKELDLKRFQEFNFKTN